MLGHPAVLPALAALAVHLQSLGNGFVRDDFPLIVENAPMRAPGGLGALLAGDFLASTGYTSGLWRPLVLLSFWLEGRMGGWTPALFHATNVLLHAGGTLLLGMLLTQGGVPRVAAFLGASWFALMPAHVESVAWITGRTDLLCGGFALLGLWLDRRAREKGRSWAGWGALAAFGAALLSKEVAAAWAGVILAAELARARRSPAGPGEVARWVAPYLAITLAWLLAHALAAGPSGLPAYVDEALRARRRAAAWLMLPHHVTFLWPWYPHASDVPAWLPASALSWPVVAGAAFTLIGMGVTVALAARRSQVAVPCSMLLVPLLPSVAVALLRGYVTGGERMMFLPSAGVAWLAALALAWARRGGRSRRWTAGALSVLLVIGSGIETLRLQPMWVDDEHVFQAMTERHPDHPAGWVGLADVLTQGGRKADAERALSRAESLDPRLPAVHLGRAELHYRYGEWDQVTAEAGRALALDDALFRARLLRASALVRLRRTAEAARDVERLLRDRPGHPAALMLDGQRLLADGRPAEAVARLAEAARDQPNDPGLWYALGVAHAAAGDLVAARAAIERTVALDPGAPAGWHALSRICAALGDTLAAAAARERGRALSQGRSGPSGPARRGPEARERVTP